MTFKDGVTLDHHEPAHDPARFGLDDVLHLHGLHDEELLAPVHEVALAHVDTHNGAL